MQSELISGRDPTTTAASKGGLQKGEIQQRGANTLMRTVKKTCNCQFREKGYAGLVKNSFQKIFAI